MCVEPPTSGDFILQKRNSSCLEEDLQCPGLRFFMILWTFHQKNRELDVLRPHHTTSEKGGLEITLLESTLRRLPLPIDRKGLLHEDQKLSWKEHLSSFLTLR